MKSILTLLCACLCIAGTAKNSTFEKLAEVNKCIREQKDVASNLQAPTTTMSETRWIQFHLQTVESTLRNRSTKHLTAAQAANRNQSLNNLNAYWHAAQFPINEDYTYRTPIFIDKHDNFCAVGYLVKASGHEAVSRKIAANTNLAYVKEMDYPELNSWAKENGFTIDELAWIQPAYPPALYADGVGKGVNGEVKELYADNADNKLYVGGSFSMVDSTLPASNIAYVTENNGQYTWHAMGSGVNGPVHAIAKVNGKVFVAGKFSMAGGVAAENVAYWDGTNWHAAGCTYGEIRDLAVMNNELYAVGDFDVCAAMGFVNFAKWNGTLWQSMWGLGGEVNTMYVKDTTIIIGGRFAYNNDSVNVIKWSTNGGFQKYANRIANEVKDIEIFNDTLYAVCKRTSTTDSLNLMVRLVNDSWKAIRDSTQSLGFFSNGKPVSLNTLCNDGTNLMLGGNFFYAPIVGIYGENCLDVTPSPRTQGAWFNVDSSINKMVVFKNSLIAGGRFKYGQTQSAPGVPSSIALNGMAKRHSAPTSVPGIQTSAVADLYPNPVANGALLTLKNNFDASKFTVTDMSGRTIASGKLQAQATQQIAMPQLAAGAYLIELSNNKKEHLVKRIMVK